MIKIMKAATSNRNLGMGVNMNLETRKPACSSCISDYYYKANLILKYLILSFKILT